MNVSKLISRNISDEKSLYLKKNWFLVGSKTEFQKHNDFKTFEIFNEPIILYKFKNEIAAFTNICPHRGSRLKIEARGNKVLNCIYHGWAFNSKGDFISAPYQKKAFNNNQVKNKCLDKWKVDYCGNLIFITKKTNKILLKNYLAKSFSQLKKYSLNLENYIGTKEYLWSCNWKLAVENSIDEYHGPILHKNTFKNTLNLKPNYFFSNKVLSMNMPLNEKYVKSFSKKSFLFKDKKMNENFSHFLFFPNTTFATTMGLFSFLQTYFPINKKQTRVSTSIFLSKTNNNKKNEVLIKGIAEMATKFNEEVFMEDKMIVEDLHRNIDNGYEFSNFGNFETRIKKFRKLL